MIIEDKCLDKLKESVALTFKNNPRTLTDFDLLAADIFRRTGRTIGVSTLKRVWGYVNSGHGTSYSTLSLLCRYCGFRDWDHFYGRYQSGVMDMDSSHFDTDDIIACSMLEQGCVLSLDWLPDKNCHVCKIAEPDLFRVVSTCNTKLQPGDTGHINSLQVGHNLLITEYRRDGKLLGNYVGAVGSGVMSIKIID